LDFVAYSQYCSSRPTKRYLEIDECLRRDQNHHSLSRIARFTESDLVDLLVDLDGRIRTQEAFLPLTRIMYHPKKHDLWHDPIMKPMSYILQVTRQEERATLMQGEY